MYRLGGINSFLSLKLITNFDMLNNFKFDFNILSSKIFMKKLILIHNGMKEQQRLIQQQNPFDQQSQKIPQQIHEIIQHKFININTQISNNNNNDNNKVVDLGLLFE